MKFRIRTLLITIAFFAIFLTLVPQYMRYRRWQGTKQQLTDWSSRLKRTPFKDETFVKMNIDLPMALLSRTSSHYGAAAEVDGAGNATWLTQKKHVAHPT